MAAHIGYAVPGEKPLGGEGPWSAPKIRGPVTQKWIAKHFTLDAFTHLRDHGLKEGSIGVMAAEVFNAIAAVDPVFRERLKALVKP